jgi:hypothetical protein
VAVVSDPEAWAAPDAENVQNDVAAVLAAQTPQAKSHAEAQLTRDLAVLNAERAKIDGPINKTIKSLAMHAAPPALPG